MFGGFNQTDGYLASVEVYTPSTNTWAAAPAMSVARAEPIAERASNGKIYVIGGYNCCTPSEYQSAVEVFNTSTRTWNTAPAMPTARTQLAGAAVGKKLFAIGGDNYSGELGTVQILHTS